MKMNILWHFSAFPISKVSKNNTVIEVNKETITNIQYYVQYQNEINILALHIVHTIQNLVDSKCKFDIKNQINFI